ncbi:MAG: hypothetical protein GX100_01220 [candidate division WS1 bacterium]|jgi:hypothetical protein|nr:hypothetical protein [candidate division WS1 bacterium]
MAPSRRLLALLAVTTALLLLLGAVASAAVVPIVDTCRQDLAQRLKVDLTQITVEKLEPVTWMSSALGLQRPGMAYAKALVPGFRVELKAPRSNYCYHTSQKQFTYAGPTDSWDHSALYLEPVENEANFNGNLYQLSLLGTNPLQLIAGVTDVAPQPDGSVLATRRTSRSGFDLLHLASGERGTEERLMSAFSFASPVLAPDGKRWATFSRPRVGTPWRVECGGLDNPTVETLVAPPLPVDGQPVRLTWEPESPLQALLRTKDGLAAFQLVENEGPARWQAVDPPWEPASDHAFSLLLNRSYTLVIETEKPDAEHPVTLVYEEHFTGTREEITRIEDFTLNRAELTPELRFALLVGQRQDKQLVLTVDLRTGEVFETLAESCGPVNLLPRPSHWEPALARDH